MDAKLSSAGNKLGNLASSIADGALKSNGRLFSTFFLLILALKWPFLGIQPVWDEAFSIFPAAQFLVDNGFDYVNLMEQPRYHDGGPTAHALSLMTLVTALVLKVTGGGTPAWVILRVMQWLMAASIAVMLTRMLSALIGKYSALLLSLACLVYPIVLAQLGFMYLEVPVLFFTLLAFTHFFKSRILPSTLFLVVACLIKGSALIGVGALVLTALCCQEKNLCRRFLDALILTAPSLVAVKAIMVVSDSRLSMTSYQSHSDIVSGMINKSILIYQAYISIVPDMIIIYGASFIISFMLILRLLNKNARINGQQKQIIYFHSFLIIVFFFFYFVLYNLMQQDDSSFLTRYFAYAIPSMLFIVFFMIDRVLRNEGILIIILVLIISVFLVNRSGALYPSLLFPNIAMAERSEEYIDGYLVAKEYIDLLEKRVPRDVPVFVSLPDYFLTQYPVNRYVTKPLSNVRYIGHVLRAERLGFEYPDHFVLVYSYPWLGGQYILSMFRDVKQRKDLSVEFLGQFSRGAFSGHVIEVRR
ncbi:MAG: hypothetical protein AB2L22_03880 [Syntrophales bacterium]